MTYYNFKKNFDVKIISIQVMDLWDPLLLLEINQKGSPIKDRFYWRWDFGNMAEPVTGYYQDIENDKAFKRQQTEYDRAAEEGRHARLVIGGDEEIAHFVAYAAQSICSKMKWNEETKIPVGYESISAVYVSPQSSVSVPAKKTLWDRFLNIFSVGSVL